MKVSTVLLVVFRIYAIYWLLQGFNGLASLMLFNSWAAMSFWNFVLSAFWVGSGLLLWAAAGPLGRLIVRGRDADLAPSTCSLVDLYSVAFLVAGLYFGVSSLGSVFVWTHYLLSVNSKTLDPTNSNAFYTAFTTYVTFATAMFLLFGSKHWARKLTKLQDREG